MYVTSKEKFRPFPVCKLGVRVSVLHSPYIKDFSSFPDVIFSPRINNCDLFDKLLCQYA